MLSLYYGTRVGMRPVGKVFDGSTSLFDTQRVLCNSIGHAIWLPHFARVRHDHLHFVQALLQEFCWLGICSALTGLYLSYIAGMLDRHCMGDDFFICHLYIAKSTSTILGPLLQKPTEFTIGEHYTIYEEVIATLCSDKDRWWCVFCNGPLFIPDTSSK